MTILDQVLAEEYDRLIRMKEVLEIEIKKLPEGYISRKNINGKVYCYLQKRSGNKIKSTYIPDQKLDEIKRSVERRRMLEHRIREVEKSMRKIKRVVKS